MHTTDLPFPDSLPNERWRPVPGFPAYAVSTTHRWRRRYTRRDGWTPPRTTESINLRRATRYSARRVSVLVALAFAEDCPRVEPAATEPPRIVGKLAPYLDQLGKVPDQSIADMAGVTRARVQQVRARLDIPAAPTETHICKLAAADRRADVAHARDRLGKAPDHVIAAELGMSRALVQTIRLEMGIAPYGHQDRPSRLAPFAHLLGTVPDSEVARLAGVSQVSVCRYRMRRGIAPCGRRRAA